MSGMVVELKPLANDYEFAEDQRSGSQDPRRWADAHRYPTLTIESIFYFHKIMLITQ